MADITETTISNILQDVIDPHNNKDLVSSKAVKRIKISDNQIIINIVLGYPADSWHAELASKIENALQQKLGSTIEPRIAISSEIKAHSVQQGLKPMPEVKNIIAVASGKGGVGKSTTSVNLALALAAEGAKVGILDADIYGPSQPMMLGIKGRPDSPDGKTIIPMQAHGIQAISIGTLIDEDTPMIWRGPMATGALQQLLKETQWKDLDYLVIDLPPGTGDIQLTLAQQIPVSGAVVVTTPQDIALLDAQKGLKMFEKVNIPVLGIVENMSIHICSECGHEEHIFGEGGGLSMSEKYGVELLGSLPLDRAIREQADSGQPTVVSAPNSRAAEIYREIARKTAAQLALKSKDYSSKFPNIVVQDT